MIVIALNGLRATFWYILVSFGLKLNYLALLIELFLSLNLSKSFQLVKIYFFT